MRYRVSMPEPHSHLFWVELAVDRPGEAITLVLPVWTPGSYLVREFSRHLEAFAAQDGAGKSIAWTRLDKNRFRVDTRGAEQVVIRYRVYSNDLTVRTSHLDGTHAFVNGANLFFYVEGREKQAHQVSLEVPPGWRVATALEGAQNEFRAKDYDELVDSPFEIGTHQHFGFAVQGKRHEVALYG